MLQCLQTSCLINLATKKLNTATKRDKKEHEKRREMTVDDKAWTGMKEEKIEYDASAAAFV